MSSFHGLEMAKQALFTQQSALYTTGHNIANANTDGYSRQRVNFETDMAFPAAARNRPGIAGQIGTGVQAGSIQRIRNEFLDLQFRGENSLAGYWEKRADSLGRMENVMNELNETGLSASMDQLWGSLQDLAVNPTNAGARSVVVERGIALADTFNYFNGSLTKIRADLKSELDVTVDNANTFLTQIDSLNEQIKSLETNGYLPNDLYDQRDVLIDRLSNMIDIEVEYTKSSDSSMDIAQGLATIKTDGKILVNGEGGGTNKISIVPDISGEGFDFVGAIQIGDDPNNTITMPPGSKGTIHSLIQAYGYDDGTGTIKGDFVEMQETLKDMAEKFVEEFNSVHKSGTHLDENDTDVHDFFEIDADGKLTVNQDIIDNPNLIAASGDGTSGDGSNALLLAAVFDTALNYSGTGEKASVKDFYASVIGSLAVKVQEAERMELNTNILMTQVETQRLSITSVSLDEEMTNMIKFQHAYNAAARSMTATDELLDRVINNMGLVGR